MFNIDFYNTILGNRAYTDAYFYEQTYTIDYYTIRNITQNHTRIEFDFMLDVLPKSITNQNLKIKGSGSIGFVKEVNYISIWHKPLQKKARRFIFGLYY